MVALIIYVFNKAILTYFVPAPDTRYLYYLDNYLPPLLLYFIATIRLCVDMPNFYDKFFQFVGPIVALNASINLFNHFEKLPSFFDFQIYRLEPIFGAGVDTHAATSAGFTYALYLYAMIILIAKKKTKLFAIINSFSMVVLIAALILTQARGALVGLSFALVIISVLSSKQAQFKIIGALVTIVSLFMAFPKIRSFAFSRGDTFRLEVWRQFLVITKKWFVFGFGDRGFGEKDLFSITVSSGEQVHHAHNILLNALWRGGIIGFVTLAYVLIGGIYKSFCYFKVTSDALPLGLLLMLSISGMVDFEAHLFPAPWLWTSVWLPMLFAIGSEAKMNFQKNEQGF
jgi:O-antigen ligase